MRSTAGYTKLQKALEDDLKKISNLLMHERYSNTLKQMTVLNLVHSEHLPQVDVQIHIMVVLRNTECWVISI